MNTFKYRIYYKYLGPSRDDPFALKPLPPDEIEHCFERLRDTLPPYFSAAVNDGAMHVTAVTSDSEQATDTELERCVVDLNLVTSGLSLLIDRLSER